MPFCDFGPRGASIRHPEFFRADGLFRFLFLCFFFAFAYARPPRHRFGLWNFPFFPFPSTLPPSLPPFGIESRCGPANLVQLWKKKKKNLPLPSCSSFLFLFFFLIFFSFFKLWCLEIAEFEKKTDKAYE